MPVQKQATDTDAGGQKEVPRERRDPRNRARPWKKPTPPSPLRMAIIIAISIYVLEALSMSMLDIFPKLSPMKEALLDASFLVVMLMPIYLFFYRPFWKDHQKASAEIRQLTRMLLRTVEDERKRVSHELHDECGQTLTALQFRLEALRIRTSEKCAEVEDLVRDLTDLVSKLSDELQDVTYSLRSPDLDQIGLVKALHNLVADFSEAHPEVEVSETYDLTDEILMRLDDDIEMSLYRICQECLNNISKYAEANKVFVHVSSIEDRVELNIGDHGVGFDPLARRGQGANMREGLGLIGIQERVADLGGTFNLSTGVGKGTFIKVELPIFSEAKYG